MLLIDIALLEKAGYDVHMSQDKKELVIMGNSDLDLVDKIDQVYNHLVLKQHWDGHEAEDVVSDMAVKINMKNIWKEIETHQREPEDTGRPKLNERKQAKRKMKAALHSRSIGDEGP